MLSIQTLKSAGQAAHYYERDDYYTRDGDQSPSLWWGKMAGELGLEGAVDRDVFRELLAGRLPNRDEVPQRPDGKRRVGYDLTFSAPKSVSIMALVAGDERVIEAHEAAVSVALDYLERTASETRVRSEDGYRRVRSGNLVVARFRHDTSRALDPQLHTHSVVINMTRAPNGGVRALSNEELLRSQMAAGAVYRSELAHGVARLGYELKKTHPDGRFEIARFRSEDLAAFSTRRKEIEAELGAMGRDDPKAAEIAALATRSPKRDVDRERLYGEWRARAEGMGLDLSLPRERAFEVARTKDSERAVGAAIEHLSERKSLFYRREILAFAVGQSMGRVSSGELEREIDRRQATRSLVHVHDKSGLAERFTTRTAIEREQALVAIVERGIGKNRGIVKRRELRDRTDAFALTRDQRAAVELVLTSRNRFVGIQGYAGTGKTTALRAIREIAEERGLAVRGFAVTAAAADVLKESGIEGRTLARHLVDERRGLEREKKGPELWILDEASLLGTKDALAFVRAAERKNARVLFVGDRAQLASIEAGKPFALMLERGVKSVTMKEIKRQNDPQLRRAVEATIDRDFDRVAKLVAPRVREVADRSDRIRAVADAYLALDARARADTLVLTSRNNDRRMLNALIRRGLEGEGALSGPTVSSRVLSRVDLTSVERRDATRFVAGSVVRVGRKYRSLGLEKGEYVEVIRCDERSNRVEAARADGSRVRFDPSRASNLEVYTPVDVSLRTGDRVRFTRNDAELERRNGSEALVVAVDPARRIATLERGGKLETLELDRDVHWDHAYARTVHSAQGRTAERAILHIDTNERHLAGYESFYVGISRARSDVQIFTDDASRLPDVLRRNLVQESALEALHVKPRERQAERAYGFEHTMGLR